MKKMYIGIIGTAGRQSDGKRLSKDLYAKMYRKAVELIADVPVAERHLVSGGAACIAVHFQCSKHLKRLLYLV